LFLRVEFLTFSIAWAKTIPKNVSSSPEHDLARWTRRIARREMIWAFTNGSCVRSHRARLPSVVLRRERRESRPRKMMVPESGRATPSLRRRGGFPRTPRSPRVQRIVESTRLPGRYSKFPEIVAYCYLIGLTIVDSDQCSMWQVGQHSVNPLEDPVLKGRWFIKNPINSVGSVQLSV
jgi:hypothetical protein